MNIILIGFMGSGKTSTGRLLAKHLGYQFIDIDQIIEQKHGMTCAKIFAQRGEDFFRKQETTALKELHGLANSVIATGGGIILSADNRSFLKNLGTLIYLKTPPAEILKRVEHDTTRPLLPAEHKLDAINKMLSVRQPLYLAAAQIIVETCTGQPEKTAAEILRILQPVQAAAQEQR
ncbi:shikimate kinase [Candidatus Termititenax persephonae]|uniref:Shikimate kinase n=1 Tax=Candidatus Termititenax persephonae TaxID=2218525 RepID=A0A388THH0_9BACT|nr:shikimate kinase [Candidatus Termititenax persephonae]